MCHAVAAAAPAVHCNGIQPYRGAAWYEGRLLLLSSRGVINYLALWWFIDINIYPLSRTRLTSPYQLTHDTGTSPQSSDSQSAVRQEHSGWAEFILQEAVYHPLITTHNHMYSYTMQLTKLI